MRNREEMRKKEPGKCASWNVGVMCPEYLFIRKYVQRGTQRKANVDLGYLPMAFKIPEITLSSFETKIFFSDSSECHLTPLKMSAIKEKREKKIKLLVLARM